MKKERQILEKMNQKRISCIKMNICYTTNQNNIYDSSFTHENKPHIHKF
jgi:hypothetical protein